jgi:anti-anti-sigma factor
VAFSATTTIDSSIAKISVSGELDGSMATVFQQEVEKAVAQKVKRLVLLVSDLDYISSAGLRVLVFARQKMGQGVDIYVVGAQQQVKDTLQMTGFDRSILALDTYDAAMIENI